jgi:hypothetical protein
VLTAWPCPTGSTLTIRPPGGSCCARSARTAAACR